MQLAYIDLNSKKYIYTYLVVVDVDMNSTSEMNTNVDNDVHSLSHNILTRFVPRCSHGSGLEAPSLGYFNARSRLLPRKLTKDDHFPQPVYACVYICIHLYTMSQRAQ